MRVLLIEDMAGFAQPIQLVLQDHGHHVTSIIGAERLDKDHILGIVASTSAQPTQDSWDGDRARLIKLNASDFDIALVDGGLIGPVNDGVDFVRYLTSREVPCIAITCGGAGNERLLQVGAVGGLPKEFLVRALKDGYLDLEEARRKDSPSAFAMLPMHFASARARARQCRSCGEKFLWGYPLFDERDG